MSSFGSGNQVKLPGPAPDKPNIYDFNTTYEEMYRDLVLKDKNLYPLVALWQQQVQQFNVVLFCSFCASWHECGHMLYI